MNLRDIDLNSDEWCNLVFKGKNKDYGAYYLRKTSSKRHLKALFIIIAFCILSLFIPLLFDFIQLRKTDDIDLKSVDITSLILLQNTDDNERLSPFEKPLSEKNEKSELLNTSLDDKPQIAQDYSTEIDQSTDSITAGETLKKDSIRSQEEEVAQSKKIVKKPDKIMNSDESTSKVDSVPEFPGGKAALLRYIYQHVKYPQSAINQHIQGQVICTFIVNENGRVSDATLIKGIHPVLDEEVLQVIRFMPTWRPAIKSGKTIKVRCFVPVTFRL